MTCRVSPCKVLMQLHISHPLPQQLLNQKYLQHFTAALRLHDNHLVVDVTEIRPYHTEQGHTSTNFYLFITER